MSMHHQTPPASRILRHLLSAEWAAGIYGLRLFMACVVIAAFLMSAVWVIGGGLSNALLRSGAVFLGGDMAISTTNFPMDTAHQDALADIATLSSIAELRTAAVTATDRQTVELKAVDGLYPLYGNVVLSSGRAVQDALKPEPDGLPIALVDPAFLLRNDVAVGDVITLGEAQFRIGDEILQEPDRLASGRFMVGPRVLISAQALANTGLVQPGSIIRYRYRLQSTQGDAVSLPSNLEATGLASGWEIEEPGDAGARVMEVVERTTTFLGLAGIAAFAIGLSGSWAAASSWISRRSRTIALYRLSGATPSTVWFLHAVLLAAAGIIGLLVGSIAGLGLSLLLLDIVSARLHVQPVLADLLVPGLIILAIMLTGLVGAGKLALSGIKDIQPGSAMRSGDVKLSMNPGDAKRAGILVAIAMLLAAFSLPFPALASLVMVGLVICVAALAAGSIWLSRYSGRKNPASFAGLVIQQSLSSTAQTATRTIAIGLGIIGITAIAAVQHSLDAAFSAQLPEKAPDLVLLDVKPSQIDDLLSRLQADNRFGGIQAHPFMRMTLTAVNGVPARDALVLEEKSWVIEGDRSFSWTAEPTGADLLQGDWWQADYDGPPLVSPEEDLMEAFDLKVGDRLTYSVLGRSFTSEVANIRKEYHRTFRPEYLLVASPNPFSRAPHTWIISLQAANSEDVDQLIRDLAQSHANITSIDTRLIISELRGVLDSAVLATLMIAGLLVIAGALSVAALISADVDARRREALVFSLVGVSRFETGMTRLMEAGATGMVAALLGGLGGLAGGYITVTQGLNLEWVPAPALFLLPVVIGVLASIAAGIAGGLGTLPRGRGEMARQLSAA